jgi:hypothetical protein
MSQKKRQQDGINALSYTLWMGCGRRMVYRLFCLLLAAVGFQSHQGLAGVLPPSLAADQNVVPANGNPVSNTDVATCNSQADNPYPPDVSQDTPGAYLLANDGDPSWIDDPQLEPGSLVVERKDRLALPNLLAPRTRDFVMLR